jgi:hypothetical protein
MRKNRVIVGMVGGLSLAALGTIPASAAANNTEHVVIVTTNPTSNTSPVAMSGPIHALGVDTQLPNNRDRFTFKAGTLLIKHTPTSSSDSFDKVTCTDQFTEHGIYNIVSGTGAYAHATGFGTYQTTGVIIGCNPKKPPTAISVIVHAAGPLKLG